MLVIVRLVVMMVTVCVVVVSVLMMVMPMRVMIVVVMVTVCLMVIVVIDATIVAAIMMMVTVCVVVSVTMMVFVLVMMVFLHYRIHQVQKGHDAHILPAQRRQDRADPHIAVTAHVNEQVGIVYGDNVPGRGLKAVAFRPRRQ